MPVSSGRGLARALEDPETFRVAGPSREPRVRIPRDERGDRPEEAVGCRHGAGAFSPARAHGTTRRKKRIREVIPKEESETVMERTLMMIKPDATERNLIGEILSRVEKSGLRIAELRKVHLSKEEAQEFYAVHKERPFYDSLCSFMTSGPIVAGVLEGDNAIQRWRDLMGKTNPAEADAGTIRKDLAESIERNSVHGSDAPETAQNEIAFFGLSHRLRG